VPPCEAKRSSESSVIELALQKQRLQLKSASSACADGGRRPTRPGFAVVDGVQDGFRWLRGHPEWLVAASSPCCRASGPSSPGRTGFFAWQIWRKFSECGIRGSEAFQDAGTLSPYLMPRGEGRGQRPARSVAATGAQVSLGRQALPSIFCFKFDLSQH